MRSNTPEAVSVTKNGQAMIPKRIHDALGIETLGRVYFRETDEGVDVGLVECPDAFRGFVESETDRSTRELLAEARSDDEAHTARRLPEAADSADE